MQVFKRAIVLATGSSTKVYDGKELTCDVFYISRGKLAEGHTVSVEVIGKQTSKGKTPNTINKESFVILDEHGNNVTDNYAMTPELGTLTVV